MLLTYAVTMDELLLAPCSGVQVCVSEQAPVHVQVT